MKPIIQTSNTINAHKLSTNALRRISTATPEIFTETTNAYLNARVKERNITDRTITKSPRTVEFATRDSVDTPPEITEYARATAIIIRNSNDITTHATTAKAFLNHIPAVMPERPAPLWVLKATPVTGKEHGRIYYADGNTTSANTTKHQPMTKELAQAKIHILMHEANSGAVEHVFSMDCVKFWYAFVATSLAETFPVWPGTEHDDEANRAKWTRLDKAQRKASDRNIAIHMEIRRLSRIAGL